MGNGEHSLARNLRSSHVRVFGCAVGARAKAGGWVMAELGQCLRTTEDLSSNPTYQHTQAGPLHWLALVCNPRAAGGGGGGRVCVWGTMAL